MNKPYFFVFPFVMKINYSASQSMRVWTAQMFNKKVVLPVY